MKKIMLVGLMVLIGGGMISCEKQVVSPLSSPLVEPAFESPLASAAGGMGFPGKIAFHSDRTGVLQIYVLHGATGQVDRLTDGPIQSFEPSWSPDCQSLVYAHGINGREGFEVFTMRADGSEKKQLFENPNVDDWAPAWSPNGDLIAYQTNAGGSLNICFVDLKGESQGCLEKESFSNALPAWSPDGKKLVFISNRDGGDWDIFVQELGRNTPPIQLTHNDTTDTGPQFSPDGSRIVFASKNMGNYDVYVMNVDGNNITQVTFDGADDVNPHWVGNDRLVFASMRTLSWNLYLVDVDGGNLTMLTDTIELDKWPRWCPID